MTERTITILSIENRRTKNEANKEYRSVETNDGRMSIWDAVVWEEIEKVTLPANFKVDVIVKGDFKNIRAIIMETDGNAPLSPEVTTPGQPAQTTRTKVLCWEDKTLSEIVEELNTLNTMATQFYPNPSGKYDCVAWLR